MLLVDPEAVGFKSRLTGWHRPSIHQNLHQMDENAMRRNGLIATLLALSALLFAAGCLTQAPTGAVNLPAGFDLQAHMGGRDARPENTLPAFAYALSIGVTTLEMDMEITSDGVPVVHHSNKLSTYLAKNPWGDFLTTDEQPDIRHTTLADLKRFDLSSMSPDAPYGYYDAHGKTQKAVPGTTIATLEEVFRLVRDWGNDEVFLSVEAKSTPYVINPANPSPEVWVKTFYDLVTKYGLADRVMLQSFDWRVLVAMKKFDSRVATVALTANQPSWNAEGDEGNYQWLGRGEPSPWMAGLDLRDYDNSAVKAAAAIDADIFATYYKEVTPEVVRQAHALGLRVVPFTVNQPEQMRAMIEIGVDGLITDRPATLRQVMRQLRMPLPPADPAPQGKPLFTGLDGP